MEKIPELPSSRSTCSLANITVSCIPSIAPRIAALASIDSTCDVRRCTIRRSSSSASSFNATSRSSSTWRATACSSSSCTAAMSALTARPSPSNAFFSVDSAVSWRCTISSAVRASPACCSELAPRKAASCAALSLFRRCSSAVATTCDTISVQSVCAAVRSAATPDFSCSTEARSSAASLCRCCTALAGDVRPAAATLELSFEAAAAALSSEAASCPFSSAIAASAVCAPVCARASACASAVSSSLASARCCSRASASASRSSCSSARSSSA